MERLILSNNRGTQEIRVITNDIDFDLGGENDFEMSIPSSDWHDVEMGQRIYIPQTEYGGLIGEIESRTSEDMIYVRGWTWRGLLTQYIIFPPTGEDYFIASGDLNTVIALALGRAGITTTNPIFAAADVEAGATVTNYQFDRYCTLLDGLEKMCVSTGYRLDISYHNEDINATEQMHYAVLSAVPAVDHSDEVEFSQSSKLNFTSKYYARGVNAMECLGSGELKDRVAIPIYALKDGFAGTLQQCVAHAAGDSSLWYKGEEIFWGIYENTNEDDAQELAAKGVEKLIEVMPYKSFDAEMASSIDEDIAIGDTIGGRDYITGQTIKKPVVQKILTISGGETTVSYKLKGED